MIMSGQMKSYSSKQKMVDDFIDRIKPYEKHENLKFDMRSYAKYLKEHKISGKNVPQDVVSKFMIK